MILRATPRQSHESLGGDKSAHESRSYESRSYENHFWGSLHPAAVRFYRPLLLFGPRRHMNRDRSRDQWESGALMDRNEVVGTANSTVGIHVKLLQRVKHHNGAN
jgi:hypothetical protein